MHPVTITSEDMEYLREARNKKDWRILITSKQRYLYQRCVALPSGDLKTVREISTASKIVFKPNLLANFTD